MGSLYIGGAQYVHASFASEDDWETFDTQETAMVALAQESGVFIARENIDDNGHHAFVVMNAPCKSKCFYSGAAFSCDMGVNMSDHFHARAQQFIERLNQAEEFEAFHSLPWSEPTVLYFVSS